jgi:tetratricopeptide (TPR) repeat protein
MCGRYKEADGKINDYGKLIIGEPQIYNVLKQASNTDLRLAIIHHPFDWLIEDDRNRVEDRLKKECHFILCGHVHVPRVEIVTGTQGNYIIIPAGASYERRTATNPRYVNAYNFVHLDFENNQGVVYLRSWSDRQSEWREDVDTYPEGKKEFPLPPNLADGVKQNQLSSEDPKELGTHSRSESTLVGDKISSPGTKYKLNNPPFFIPYRAKGEGVVGRADALRQVRQQLTDGKKTAIGHTVAFQGLGGLGKTQLAVEYAHTYRNEYPNGVVWIQADQEIEPQLIRLAKESNWISPASDHAIILEVAKRRLKTYSNCLIIFDNVESQQYIETYLPEAKATPHLLITSRVPQKDFLTIEICLLDDELSLELLLKEARRKLDNLPEKEQEAARAIAESLGGLPLAIEIAGAYLSHLPNVSFRQYQEMLEANLKSALKGEMLSSFTKHEQDLFLTLRISEPVFKTAPLLKNILNLLAWSGSGFMGLSLMAAILNIEKSELYHPLNLGVELRLLNKVPEENRYEIHRLVSRVKQEQFPLSQKREWIAEVCQQLGDWFKARREDFNDLPEFELEIDHLRQWLNHARNHYFSYGSHLIWLQAYPHYHRGQYHEAYQLVQSALQQFENISDPNLELKAHILNDLGFINGELGNYDEALKHQKQALKIQRQLFGEQHSDTAMSLNNIGIIYNYLGNYKEGAAQIAQELDSSYSILLYI